MDIPDVIKIKMQNFTDAIRCGNSTNKNILIYRDSIIANISSVLDNTFPYFSTYASTDLKKQIIKVFLEENTSLDPAFHQIATELLKCSKNLEMSEQLSKLIEFEWLLFSVEISDSKVCKSNEKISNIDFADIKGIDINPTVEFLSLPFDASSLDKNVDLKEESFYIVYRNLNHRTYYREISPIEFALISSALKNGVEVFDSADFKNLDDSYKEYLIQQLIIWHNLNIITMSLSN
ncbi:DUF2063 domain-containing protein [Francisella halioticida]|uniref:HvfC/BufC family peptide modification chaperone n=1 Tax=Francisella halioticida TaxID=549298 RepID=UPI001AF5E31F|nr:putative DNA-binding domain-containing protein [Francisella halioticida]BCD90155.1 DUF2063 domain-containing protein [Francisella halioticida]